MDPDGILQSHGEAQAERCRQQATVPLAQGTKVLNWARPEESPGRLFVHATLAFGEGRPPLGVSGEDGDWRRALVDQMNSLPVLAVRVVERDEPD